MRRNLDSVNKFSVEIGAADGTENNTSWLVMMHKYNSLLVEGNPDLVKICKLTIGSYSVGSEIRSLFVTIDNAPEVAKGLMRLDPDVFSLDIDGNDYHIMKALMDAGMRPKIVVVEYNSAFGPVEEITIQYHDQFSFRDAHPSHLYYGVSVSLWRRLFAEYGYQFVTVDSNGVNAFFVNPDCFDSEFLASIRPVYFAENVYQMRKFRLGHEYQFQLINDQSFCRFQ